MVQVFLAPRQKTVHITFKFQENVPIGRVENRDTPAAFLLYLCVEPYQKVYEVVILGRSQLAPVNTPSSVS